MAKTKISEFDVDPSNNTDINSINIAEGCAPSGINNAIRQLMSDLKEWQNGSSGDSMTVAGTLTASGTLNVTGNLQLDGSAGTAGQVLLSAGSGSTPTWGSGFPTGGIIIWSGAANAIPSGWLLCDGSNSTPDLRNRFVVGAGSTYAVGATGGSADAIVVSHTHTASTNSAGAHTHTMDRHTEVSNTAKGTIGDNGTFASTRFTAGMSTEGAHTHTVTIDSAGSSATNANLPPYYALCYIMKS
jgi:microcystin-dependent protein